MILNGLENHINIPLTKSRYIVQYNFIYAFCFLLGSGCQWIWSCVQDVNMGECQKLFVSFSRLRFSKAFTNHRSVILQILNVLHTGLKPQKGAQDISQTAEGFKIYI